jgi:hypothetical protein
MNSDALAQEILRLELLLEDLGPISSDPVEQQALDELANTLSQRRAVLKGRCDPNDSQQISR